MLEKISETNKLKQWVENRQKKGSKNGSNEKSKKWIKKFV